MIQPPTVTPEPVTDAGLRALAGDLRAPEDPGALDARRRAVVERLQDAGLGPELLEALLPGWGRYRDDGTATDRRTASG